MDKELKDLLTTPKGKTRFFQLLKMLKNRQAENRKNKEMKQAQKQTNLPTSN